MLSLYYTDIFPSTLLIRQILPFQDADLLFLWKVFIFEQYIWVSAVYECLIQFFPTGILGIMSRCIYIQSIQEILKRVKLETTEPFLDCFIIVGRLKFTLASLMELSSYRPQGIFLVWITPTAWINTLDCVIWIEFRRCWRVRSMNVATIWTLW